MNAETNQNTDDLMTRFLLDDLSEEERSKVEERFLADGEFFDRLLAMEDSLIDQFLLERLTDKQRERMEVLVESSPEQRREVEFTEELISFLREVRSKDSASPSTGSVKIPAKSKNDDPTPWSMIVVGLRSLPRAVVATVGVIVLVASISLYLIFRSYSEKQRWIEQRTALERSVQDTQQKLSEELSKASELGKQLDLEKEAREKAEDSLAQLQSRSLRRFTTILLEPIALERGGSPKTITLKSKGERVQIQLKVSPNQNYHQYSVAIITFDGRPVWSRESIPTTQINRGKLVFLVPSSLLKYDDYRIELKARPENGELVHLSDYAFKVRD
jgi:hypothetical protein